MEWVLSPDVPRRLQLAAVPEPGLPGTSLGDHVDSAMRVTRSLVQELTALRRHGHWPPLRFTISLERGRPWDAAMRALLRDALRCAAEGGEPRFVFDEPGDPSRGGRWLRRRVAQLPDPLRFPHPRHRDLPFCVRPTSGLVPSLLVACQIGINPKLP